MSKGSGRAFSGIFGGNPAASKDSDGSIMRRAMNVDQANFDNFSKTTDQALLRKPSIELAAPSFSANASLSEPTNALLEIFRARQQEVLTRRSLGQIRIGR